MTRILTPSCLLGPLGILVSLVWTLGFSSPTSIEALQTEPAVRWEKEPEQIALDLDETSKPVVFHEVMMNQSDPAGLGGFTFTLAFDTALWQQPVIDLAPAYALFAESARSLECWTVPTSANRSTIACASTGTIGVGPVWSGRQVLATVTMRFRPEAVSTLISQQPAGFSTSIRDVDVQVTNTCGQPLNDGSLQPVPGQYECQGLLLPGLAPGGVVLNPGTITITVNPKPGSLTPTPTHTRTPTTMTPAPTETRVPSSTPPPLPTKTPPPAATRTPSRPPTSTRTAVPGMPPATATLLATATSGTPPCPRTVGFWRNHPRDWPLEQLTLGGERYSKQEAAVLLDVPTEGDASVILAHQLIAAKLNVAAGELPAPLDVIALGDALLGGFSGKLPYHVSPSTYHGQGMVWTAAKLDSYNNSCSEVLARSRPPSNEPASRLPQTGLALPGGTDNWIITALSLAIAVLLALLIRRLWDEDITQ